MGAKAKKSIITEKMGTCFMCGGTATQMHHMISGTANRRISDEDGLVMPVCNACHTKIHANAALCRMVKSAGEQAWMKYYGKTEDDFRKRYGKSYLI